MFGVIVRSKYTLIFLVLMMVLAYLTASQAFSIAMTVLIWWLVGLLIILSTFGASHYLWIIHLMFRNKGARLVADRELAKLEPDAERARIEMNRMLAFAALEQIRLGAIYPADLTAGKFAHLPASASAIAAQSVTSMPVSLPEKIELGQIIPRTGPSLNALALGIEATDSGLIPVTSSLSNMVHVGIGGSSGWGKSVFIQCLALQIALAPEAVQMALLDIEGQTFSPFVDLGPDRLRYPVAADEIDMIKILDDLAGEWKRRRGLYQRYPQAGKLEEYNQLAIEQLPPIVLMMDEVNMVSDNPEIMTRLTKLGQGTRKYGLYLKLGAQNWNANSIPTKLRDNFSTRIQLKAMSKSQSRVMLEDSAAADIHHQGQAIVLLPGHDQKIVQTPYISKTDIMRALTGLNRREYTAPVMPELIPNDYERAVIDAAQEAKSWNNLHHLVSGTTTNVSSLQAEKYKSILQKHRIQPGF